MTGLEIVVYVGLYAAIMVIGIAVLQAKAAKKDNASNLSYDGLSANENYERPRLGTGVGQNTPTSTYVKISSQRKAS